MNHLKLTKNYKRRWLKMCEIGDKISFSRTPWRRTYNYTQWRTQKISEGGTRFVTIV